MPGPLQEICSLAGHYGQLISVAFSPNGRTIVTGGTDCLARLWCSHTGRELTKLKGHSDWVVAVAVSQNGRLIVTASWDGTLRLWDMNTYVEIVRISGSKPPNSVSAAVSISPNGDLVACALSDNVVSVWHIPSKRRIWTSPACTSEIMSIVANFEAHCLIIGTSDGKLSAWNYQNNQLLWRVTGPQLFGLGYSQQENGLLVCALAEKFLEVRHFATGHLWGRLACHDDWIRAVTVSFDGCLVVTGSDDKTVGVWDLLSKKKLHELGPYVGELRSVALSPDGHLAIGASDVSGDARMWNIKERRELFRITRHEGEGFALAFVPNCNRLVTGGTDYITRVWGIPDGEELLRLEGKYAESIYSVAVSPCGNYIATGASDGNANVWSTDDGQLIFSLAPQDDGIWSIIFTPDGRQIVTATTDGQIRIWDMAGSESLAFARKTRSLTDICISSDGTRIIVAGKEGLIAIRHINSGRVENSFAAFDHDLSAINCVAISADDQQLLTGSDDGMTRIWALESGKLLKSFERHAFPVLDVMWMPRYDFVVTASCDGIRLLEISTGRTVWHINLPEVHALALSLDFQYLACACRPPKAFRIFQIIDRGYPKVM